MKKSSARAPGKCIFTGEYSVIFQKPALCCALDVWMTATVETHDAPEIYFPNHSRLLEHAVHRLLSEFNQPSENLKISIKSDIPIGSGLGSSAALIVSVALALSNFFNIQLPSEKLIALCRDIENFQHGRSSGLDIATVYYGGLYHSQLGKISAELPQGFALKNTGRPSVTTGECVEAIKQRFPESHEIWQAFENCSNDIYHAIVHHQCDELARLLRANEVLLERLGVVPAPLIQKIRELHRKNIVAKISGAGAISGETAGILLMFSDQPLDSDFTFTSKGAHLVSEYL